uniref:Uncharacterized protein n=2 Tax=Ciona intestinalis TaxID=7719 RepID=F6Y631_CIOIN
MRIREEVRLQIKKEIQAEIDQQRKQVLQDPELKSQIMELEALKQSAVKSTDIKPVTSTPEGPTDSFTVQQDQHKKDMNQWLEKHGKRASEMNVEEMRRMQTMYMQQLHHWSQQQQKAYMQWYWHQQQNYKQHYFSQKSGFYNNHPTSGAGDQKAPVSGPDSQQRGPNQSHMVSNLPPGVRPPLDQGQHSMSSMHQRPPDGQNMGNPTFTRAPSQHNPPNKQAEGVGQQSQSVLMTAQSQEQRFQQQQRNFGSHYNNRPIPYHHDDPHRHGNHPRMPPPHDRRDLYPPNPLNRGREFYPPGPDRQFPPNRFENYPDKRQQPRFAPPQFRPGSYPEQLRPDPHMQKSLNPEEQSHLQEHLKQQQQPPVNRYNQPIPTTQQFKTTMPLTSIHGASNQPNQGPTNPPLHQYPPPGMETNNEPDDCAPGTTPPPKATNDQPPPPGVESLPSTSMNAPIISSMPPGGDDLAPPGDDQYTNIPPPNIKNPNVEESPAKASKKKKKKHRRKKKRRSSSEEEDDADEVEEQRAKIMEQLKILQAGTLDEVDAAEVEDGEVQSGDEGKPVSTVAASIAALTAMLPQLERKKKKHKREKKKKRRKRDSSSEEEEHSEAPQPIQAIQKPHFPPGHPPQHPGYPGIHHPMQGRDPMVPVSGIQPQYQAPPTSRPHNYPYPDHQLPHGGIPFSNPDFAQRGQNPQTAPRNDAYPIMGPSGDNQTVPRKRSPSPLPLVFPNDPVEMEAWARKMEQRYSDHPQAHEAGNALKKLDMSRPIESVREALRDMEHRTALDQRRPEEQRILEQRGFDQSAELRSRRKRDRAVHGGRGRKKRRMQRNYRDWDQPEDDGLVYYYSESGSSGWGSDQDFDDLLAKKQRETGAVPIDPNRPNFPVNAQPINVTNTRRQSPAPGHPHGHRPNEAMGEVQGIQVIGGSQPQPIPSLANRSGPRMSRPDPMRDRFELAREEELLMAHDIEYMNFMSEQRNQLYARQNPPHPHPVPHNVMDLAPRPPM